MGDNLYSREKSYNGTLTVRCIHHKASTKHCKARAQMDEHTLQVTKRMEEHTCEQDPDQKIQLVLESKMKQLATTTGDSIRKIYDDVSLENPRVAVKIGFPRLEAAMRKRREKTTPNNPTNFTECVQSLEVAVTYNKYLQHTILEEGEGALIFATQKGLEKANSPEVKVGMTDATFKCCPKKEHTGIYQMLIFHIMMNNSAIPIMHAPMTAKTEKLYNEIFVWLKQECPQLNPENSCKVCLDAPIDTIMLPCLGL